MSYFASKVKVEWGLDPDALINHASQIAERALAELARDGLTDNPIWEDIQLNGALKTLPPESMELLLTNSISPIPLHKALTLLECLKKYQDERYHRHELLAFAKALVSSISNLHFGPEVGVSKPKRDARVIGAWLDEVKEMAEDLHVLKLLGDSPVSLYHADSRRIQNVLNPNSIDAVITSPPYPNEKDYTRSTRLESVLLGFIQNKSELQELKRGLLRSNTRNVYKGDDDDQWITNDPEIQRIAAEIETRRVELGKTSGFERLYPKVAKLYFGGMARHLAELRTVLRPGAKLAYVVGDQASYLRVMIRTGQLLGEIAKSLGYELVSIDLFRTRLATATKQQMREEVVVLRWPGYTAL